MGSLAGLFDREIWSRYVLSTAIVDDAVRDAVIALGSLERGDPYGNEEYALKHYSRSMRTLQSKIPLQGRGSTSLILVTCLLFVAFEFRKSGWVVR
jgi:hypothetical protein